MEVTMLNLDHVWKTTINQTSTSYFKTYRSYVFSEQHWLNKKKKKWFSQIIERQNYFYVTEWIMETSEQNWLWLSLIQPQCVYNIWG